MKDAGHLAAGPGREFVEIDGIYVKVSGRLRTLVFLLTHGCTEVELRREVASVQHGHAYEAAQLRELINRLFLPHNLEIDDDSRCSSAIWRLHSKQPRNAMSGFESALRCRMTVVPELMANRLAQSLKLLYTPIGATLALTGCILAIAVYLLRFGVASLSLKMLFKSIHEASALSVAVTIATIGFATLFHEFGHCAAVAAFGLRVRRIGFGIYWLSPALFSDVSATWTLTRWQRVAVDVGGIYFQMLVCCLYGVLSVLTNSSALHLAFQIAIIVNIVAIVSSLNPIMKCDGYWIISDALCIPNLRRQSERALRGCLRSVLYKGVPKSTGEAGARRFLIGYGIVSLLFSIMMLILFAAVIRQNASETIYFPKELWSFLANKLGSESSGPECARLAFDFLKVVPVACAPIALVTAASAFLGFVSRTASDSD